MRVDWDIDNGDRLFPRSPCWEMIRYDLSFGIRRYLNLITLIASKHIDIARIFPYNKAHMVITAVLSYSD